MTLVSHPLQTHVAFDILSHFASSGDLEALCVDTATYFKFRGPFIDLIRNIFDSVKDLVDTWSRCPPELEWNVISSVSVEDACASFKAYFSSKTLEDFFCRRLSDPEFQRVMSHPGDDYPKIREILRVHGVLTLMLLKKLL
jgi:hypothetical protein